MSEAFQKYRPDIDGLRAVAIAPVVAFHAFPAWAPGGFVGVDVFFVISGYLISLIILERLDAGTFTLASFYARRVRRIFPALVLVLAVCLAWGWFALFASDFALLGKHTAAGAGFAANLVFWGEAGYFDGASETKPLLHLWSLGIEEQFYLLWPTLLYVAWKGRASTLVVVGTVGIASFLYNAVQVRTDEVAAFYSPLTRLWELALGGGAAYLTLAQTRATFSRRWALRFWRLYGPGVRNVAAFVGLGAIVAAIFLFDRDTSFPGWRAALPAGGALLLITAGPDAWLNRQILALPPMVALGLISYPLYLWHWPLLSFATLTSSTPSPGGRAALVTAGVVLAWITYQIVEKPVRFVWRGGAPIALLSAAMIATGAAGYITFAREGFIDRAINRSDKAHFIAYYERMHKRGLSDAYRAECDFMDWTTEQTRAAIDPSCTLAGEHGTVFLWGDSHAQALSHGLRTILPDGMRLAQVTTSACPPRLREPQPAALAGRCDRANAYARERISALKPDLVVLAQIFGHEATDWNELAQWLRTAGAKRVVLVGPAPQWRPTLPVVVANHYWGTSYSRVDEGLQPEMFTTDSLLRARYAHSDWLEYVSLIGGLCGDGGCIAVVPGADAQLLAVDNGHLSPAGSAYVAESILRPVLFGR
jgi:peptidoglycan/LPS O-acetylase OafA/YrhL